MNVVNPYLNFNGNCEEAFNFYKSIFGGEFGMLMRFKDVPSETGKYETEGEKVMHVSLPLSKTNVLMGSDVPASMPIAAGGNTLCLSIGTDSKAEADRLFNGLAAGGTINMPITDTFWGAYFGMVKDKFGFYWQVSFDKNHLPS